MSFINHKAVCVAALSLLAFGRPAGAQAVSEARVQELLAQAKAQVQQPAQQAAAAPAPAATTIDLTMEQAVAKAVDQNIDLTVARLGPQIQNFNFLQAKGAFAPTVSSTVGEYARSSISTNTLSGGQTVDQKTTTYNAALSQPLPWWGGTASVNWTNTRGSSNSTISTYNPNYNSLFTAQLVQPLLRNRKIDTNRQTLLTSEISRRLADVTLRATTINTIANTRNAYWELVYAVQAVEVARQSLDLANRLVEDNKAKVEIGTLAPLDVVSAQSEAASRQLALVQAVATRQTSELTLKRLLVAGTSDPLWTAALNPTDRPPAVPEKIDVESALRRARAELRRAPAEQPAPTPAKPADTKGG
jgi:outer membrane protein TolC